MIHILLQQWQPFLVVAILSIMWAWESISPFFRRERRLKHGARNLIISGINAIILALAFGGATVALSAYSTEHRTGLLYVANFPESLHSIFAFLLLDFWTYWWHRMNHVLPFLWRFHSMHHSDPEMDVTTATRFHLGEITMSSIIRLALILIIGIPIWVLIVYDVVLLASTQFHHANIFLPQKADRYLRYLIVSPFMHKVHHSRLKFETDSNFTSLFSLWDRLFGSYRDRENYADIRFGLDGFDSDESQSVKGLLATPLVSPQRAE